MNDYIDELTTVFAAHAQPEIAAGQKAYMKDQFEYLGITSPQRKALQKRFLTKSSLPPKVDIEAIVKQLWKMPEREYQYVAQELLAKFKRQFVAEDMALFEWMIVHKSWWDTVDMIASHLVGTYFRLYPKSRASYVDKWLESGNMWLQRTALLFQLSYKKETDAELLAYVIHALPETKEFFINKAIGWALRQYSKTNPGWVRHFAETTPLSKLSYKEAVRLLDK